MRTEYGVFTFHILIFIKSMTGRDLWVVNSLMVKQMGTVINVPGMSTFHSGNPLSSVVLQEKGDKDGEEKKPGEGEEGDGENEELEDEEEELGDDDYAQVRDASDYIFTSLFDVMFLI